MSLIEIQRANEAAEQLKLSKSQPLSVGTHASNDVRVDDDEVALLHCRISWNKSAYEVVAADSRGVDLNGKLVQHAVLRPGDVVRVGSVDIKYVGDKQTAGSRQERAAAASYPKSDVGLEPLTEEVVSVAAEKPRTPAPLEQPPGYDDGERPSRKKSSKSTGKQRDRESRSRRAEVEVAADEVLEVVDDVDDDALTDRSSQRDDSADNALGAPVRRYSRSADARPEQETWKSRVSSGRARPGEQDALRSPFVLILCLGAAALLLAAATFFFLNRRTASSRIYDAATAEMEAGRYTQAIQYYDQFIKEYPSDPQGVDAAINRGRARILSNIEGTVPLWSAGLKTLQEFIDENRDRSSFPDLQPDIVEYAGKIALGAAKTAETQQSEVARRRETLALSTAALGIIERYASRDEPPVEMVREIEMAVRAAESSILKQQTFESAVAGVEQAITNADPMAAIEGRRNLINQYPEFEKHKKLTALLERILETEKSRVSSEEFVRDAVVEERISLPAPPLTFAMNNRARTDVTSKGRVVIALAQDCCEGVDADTGDPIWRRVVGLDAPFFPISASASVPALLMFDTYHHDLLLVEHDTGKLIWRQPLEEDLSGAPLVEEGQVFVPTLGNHVYKLDLASGRISARLNFSQKLLAPPALDASRQRMIVAGDREVFYTLTMRPFECAAVSFTGHQPGTIEAPLLTMGSLLMAAVNDKLQSSLLRVFDTRDEQGVIKEVASVKVDGAVRDKPTLRGNQLFVTSTGLRISSFAVSDTDSTPLAPGPRFQGQSPYTGPVDLLAGPDGQLWMAADALAKLEVSATAITADSRRIAMGLSSQPIQAIGRDLYVGRRVPAGNAVYLSRVDRDEMTSQWRTVLGSSVLASKPADDASIICVTEDGSVYRVEERELAAGGFKKTAVSRLKLPELPTSRLQVSELASGRLAVASAAPPQLWVVGKAGQIDREENLPKPLEANPVELAAGIVLPVPGRLSFIPAKAGAPKVEDYVAPVGEGQETKWKQLVALDETEFLALNDRGLLARYQYRPEPVPHLDVAQSVQLEKPVDLPLEVHDGKIFLAAADARLDVLDATTLDPVGSTALESAPTSAPFVIGDRVYVATAESGFNCHEFGPELKKLWSMPLENVALAGRPLLVDGVLVVALADGNVVALTAGDGTVRRKLSLGQPLADGPRQVGSRIVVTSIDGSLYPIEAVLQTENQ